MTRDDAQFLLERCSSPVGTFYVGCNPPDDFWLQVHGEHGHGRKWRLSKYMTDSEVVRTAFMATLAYVEHEAREGFKWDGLRIFSPHIHIDALAVASTQEDRRRGELGAWERELS